MGISLNIFLISPLTYAHATLRQSYAGKLSFLVLFFILNTTLFVILIFTPTLHWYPISLPLRPPWVYSLWTKKHLAGKKSRKKTLLFRNRLSFTYVQIVTVIFIIIVPKGPYLVVGIGGTCSLAWRHSDKEYGTCGKEFARCQFSNE